MPKATGTPNVERRTSYMVYFVFMIIYPTLIILLGTGVGIYSSIFNNFIVFIFILAQEFPLG
jgi:hypothetical protein